MEIVFHNVSKQFNGCAVLSNLCWTIRSGERWLVSGPSGAGKTTLLRLLLGLETPDAGQITGTDAVRFSVCFQEDRLCKRLNSIMNTAMVCEKPDWQAIRRALTELLPEEAVDRPAETLSGGMARRAALGRALLAPSQVVVLDEPFAGLDADTRAAAAAFTERHLADRTLILVSHELETLANAKVLRI